MVAWFSFALYLLLRTMTLEMPRKASTVTVWTPKQYPALLLEFGSGAGYDRPRTGTTFTSPMRDHGRAVSHLGDGAARTNDETSFIVRRLRGGTKDPKNTAAKTAMIGIVLSSTVAMLGLLCAAPHWIQSEPVLSSKSPAPQWNIENQLRYPSASSQNTFENGQR